MNSLFLIMRCTSLNRGIKDFIPMPDGYLSRLVSQFIPGMTLGMLGRVLARHRFHVSPIYMDRLAFLILSGAFNSINAWFERRDNLTEILSTRIDNPPVLILGQWRSGTTHLHNLLGCHPDFHCPTLYQTMFPEHFAYSQRVVSHIVNWLAPATRPMDNVPLSALAPHEDEFALAALCGISPYLRFLFPSDPEDPQAALDPRDLSPRDRERWQETFVFYLRKLTFSSGRRLVLKSPPHTGRVETILEVLPQAKFIHILRNPYDVYLSSVKLWHDGASLSHLQRPTPQVVDEIILSWHLQLFELFERDRHLIPEGSLVEIRYETLVREPETCLARIFSELDLPCFDDFLPRCRTYLDSMRDYKRNTFVLDTPTRDKIADRWSRMFDVYGYPF